MDGSPRGDEAGGTPAPTDTAAIHREMALVSGVLYGAGAALLLVSLTIPQWPVDNRGWLVWLVAWAGVGAGGFGVVLARGVFLPRWVFTVTALIGTVIVTALVVLGGVATSGVHGIFYAFVTSFSFYYFRLPHAVVQTAVAAAGYAAALSSLDVPGWPAQWVLTVGAGLMAGAITGNIGQRVRGLLAQEQAATRRLAELDTIKSTLLRSVAHDLRAPLTNVKLALISFQGAAEGERNDQMLEVALRNTARLEQMLHDLLDVERIEAEALQPRHDETDLHDLVRSVLDETDLADHPLEVDLAHATVTVDRVMVERIVDNLVRNAARHTPAGTPIRVRLVFDTTGTTLTIEDEGPGIDRSIADAFNATLDRDGSAGAGVLVRRAGIGLSLVAQLARLNGVTARIDERPGGGTRVVLTFPPHDVPVPSADGAAASSDI